MATLTSMSIILNPKCMTTNPCNKLATIKPVLLPKAFPALPKPITPAAAIAGAIFSTLSSTDTAFAVQQIADIAEGDNHGLALFLPLVPAVAWVLFNILQPALNQINRMRSQKGIVIGHVGLSAAGLMGAESASAASELGLIADASGSSDSRGLLLLFVVAPAIAWVLYNILQPALNQINRMRS